MDYINNNLEYDTWEILLSCAEYDRKNLQKVCDQFKSKGYVCEYTDFDDIFILVSLSEDSSEIYRNYDDSRGFSVIVDSSSDSTDIS